MADDWRKRSDFSNPAVQVPGCLRAAGIPTRYAGADLDRDFPKSAELYTANGPGASYYITGSKLGTGKTHLLCAMLRDRKLARDMVGKDCLYRPTEDLLQELRDSYGRPRRSRDDKDEDEARSDSLITRLSECPVLGIDDLGAERITDWTRVTLYQIINARYNEMLPLYVTSNYNLKELAENFDPRIASRLGQMCTVIKLTGKDRRV